MPERFAIFYAPSANSELWRRAAIWLGRDALTGAALEADIGGIDPEHRHHETRAARRYGFHATLKAPMTLDGKLEGKDLDRALKAWAATRAPVAIGRLHVASLGGFLALIAVTQPPALTAFAQSIVEDFDGFRAPLSPAERERRLAAPGLTPRQVELIDRFGYPYVAEEFLFHMTLTDRLAAADQAAFRTAIDDWFGPLLAEEFLLDRLVLFHESEPGSPFRRLRDYPLTGDR